ncbi:MAG: hypothetical protein JWP30_1066 [Homoserinimonas sp.]|jgi:hypothetical protein|nr:hypothetical protein [Homoserinimonas sp.]
MPPRLFRAREPIPGPERPAPRSPSRVDKRAWRMPTIITACTISGAFALGLIFAPEGADLPKEASVASAPKPVKTSAPAPAATSDPSAPVGALSPEVATTAVQSLLLTLASDPAGVQPDDANLTSLATGAILNEIAADTQELAANGWTRTGAPKVDGIRMISNDASAAPATAVVEVCVDSTEVRLLDVAGDVIGDPLASPRSLNTYSLVNEGNIWRVSARTFPDDAAC